MKDNVNGVDILKVFLLVSVLIISTLSFTLGIIGTEPGDGDSALPPAGETVGDLGSARQAGGPMVEAVPPATPMVAFLGQQDVTFDIVLRSLNVDDDNDQNGDNVLYNMSILGTNPSSNPGEEDNLMKFNFNTREFEDVSSSVFTWTTSRIDTNDHNNNNYMLYTAGNYGPWKYVMNNSNNFLDENNNGMIDADEYWSVRDGDRTYGNFMLNVDGLAEPGHYRMKFKVSYEYQNYQEVNMSGVGNDTTPNLPVTKDNLFNENEALGAFKYYYWVPWDFSLGAPGAVPTDLDNLYQNDTANFDFNKVQLHQGSSAPYNNIWEALMDNGVARPGSHADINGDGYTRWLPSYPWIVGQPGFDIDADFNNWILSNYPAQPIPDQPALSNGNLNVNQGNGSWTYHGRNDETIWESPPKIHTDDVWFDIIINSSIFPEEDLNEDNETNDLKLFASDDDYYTGSTFEEFYLKVGNQDPNIEMRDVQAQLFLPTNFQKGGMVFYKDIDTATVQRIDPFENISMNYRLSVDAVTPPGYYYGSLQVKYTKRYQVSQLDPLGNPLTVDVPVTESHWVVQIMVDYTPELGDASIAFPSVGVRAKPVTQIDTSTGKQLFEFTVQNTGNVELFGGDMGGGNLHLNFADFKQMGQDYFDSDADPGIEFEPIPIDTVPVGKQVEKLINVTIPNHWYLEEGIYRLYLNFTGYYYDNGALGNSSGFRYMEMNWVGFNDDDQPRECFAMMDKNANESIGDPEDAMRAVEGIYTDIYINPFDPTEKELAIIDYYPKTLNQESLAGGAYDFNVTFENQQGFDMHNVMVEFDIEGYFDESYYYDWTIPTSRVNPKAHIDQLAPDEEWTVNFTVADLDKLLPQGEHHIPVKYSYEYYEYDGAEERTTYSMIWDTSVTPFKPYIDANANFILNKGGGATRAGSSEMDIMFVVDITQYSSTSYYTRLKDGINAFMGNVIANGVDPRIGVVAFHSSTNLVQDLTTDINDLEAAFDSLGAMMITYDHGGYDAVMETLANTLDVGGPISYRPGATKVIILVSDYRPNTGTTNENTFKTAVIGAGIFYAIIDGGYDTYYDETTVGTGGQMFNVYNGDYTPFFSLIADSLGGLANGVTPAGKKVYDVPLEDVADPNSVDLDTYGPYLMVIVEDTAFDFDITMTSSPIWLGDRIRNVNVVIRLTNQEYVQYTDIELYLPLAAEGETVPLFINPVNATDPLKGTLSSTTLSPKGGTITATFNVDINTNANSGVFEFQLDFMAMNDYTKQIVQGGIPVNIRVYPKEPILIIPQLDPAKGTASVTAKDIEPGDSFTLTFTLQNIGEDTARDVYVTLSNDWYEDDPFTTIDTFVTSVSSHTTSYYPNGNLRNVSRVANTKLNDLGISKTSDIVDVERQLLAPTAVVPRVYIDRIGPGDTVDVSFRLRADTHMVLGRPYQEYVLLEYIDSDGLIYRYDETNPQLSTQPLPITIYTKEHDQWQEDETTWSETLAILLIIIIVIIIIVLLLSSVFQRRRMGEEPDRYRYDEEEEEEELPPDEEDLEEEEPEEEEPEEDEPEEENELEEEKPGEDEPDWSIDDEEKESPDEEEPKDNDDDWAISEEKTKKKPMVRPPKGKMPVKGKAPGKAPAEDEDIDDWE